MKTNNGKSRIAAAAARLRAIVLGTPEGDLVGSEESLIDQLQVSRSTVRQVARLLEREGLLRVRRGINGGYFGSRPNVHTIEANVSAYLETFDTDLEDVFAISSVLWVEVMRKATANVSAETQASIAHYRDELRRMSSGARYEQVLAFELETRNAIFELTGSRYIQLIFQINMAFAQRRLASRVVPDDASKGLADFVRDWKAAKLLELEAILSGDAELAMMSARHIRNLWHRQMLHRVSASAPM